jgi:tripartite-type tricarboxylate transporter receptor subunit TctC
MFKHWRSMAVSVVALSVPSGVVAQPSWPQKPVRLVIGFAAGTSVDVMSRVMAGRMAESWGQPTVVEPVVGAAGNLAAERVARAAPDGYTLLWSGNAAIVVNPSIYPRLGYDPRADFAPVTRVAETPNVVVVHPSVPASNIQQLVRLARQRPGDLTYGSAGVGTSTHIAGELMRLMAGAPLTHVPYKGGQGIVPDLLAGRIAVAFANIAGATVPLARQGKLRPLAVTSARRSALLPDLPTVSESGIPGFEAVAWFGILAPRAVPEVVAKTVHEHAMRALAAPDLRTRYAELGLEIVGSTPQQFASTIDSELLKWGKVIKTAGIRLE